MNVRRVLFVLAIVVGAASKCFAADTKPAAAPARAVPVIFDTDIGDDIDDALALALALQSPELDVRGVTLPAESEPPAALAAETIEQSSSEPEEAEDTSD